jgi:hypothetical protein
MPVIHRHSDAFVITRSSLWADDKSLLAQTQRFGTFPPDNGVSFISMQLTPAKTS